MDEIFNGQSSTNGHLQSRNWILYSNRSLIGKLLSLDFNLVANLEEKRYIFISFIDGVEL